MKKKALVAMAALAVMFYSVPVFAAAATCQDWKGAWQFTYDNATTTQICFDNSSITDDAIALCDNDSAPNCVCITDNASKPKLCIDNSTFTQCDNDSVLDCTCIDNPLYGLNNGNKSVTITQALDNLTFQGNPVPCLATGTQGTTPVTIVQVDNATVAKLAAHGIDVAPLTYIVFEGTIDNATFAQILPANFKKGADNTTFTAEENFNLLGLASGIKNAVVPPVECTLTIIPKKIHKLFAFANPISPFVIIAPSDVAFAKPIAIDWGTDAINNLFKIRIGKRIIFGLIFTRPFKLVAGDFEVDVTYGDAGAACGTITVK